MLELFGKIPRILIIRRNMSRFGKTKAFRGETRSLSIFDGFAAKAEGRYVDEIDRYISGERSMDEFHSRYKSDHAVDVIETM